MAKIRLNNRIVVEGNVLEGEVVFDPVIAQEAAQPNRFVWTVESQGKSVLAGESSRPSLSISTSGLEAGEYVLAVKIYSGDNQLPDQNEVQCPFVVQEAESVKALKSVGERLQVISDRLPNPDEPVVVSIQNKGDDALRQDQLWTFVRNRSQNLTFDRYQSFINRVLCRREGLPDKDDRDRREAEIRKGRANQILSIGTDAYDLLQVATDVFLLLESGVRIGSSVVDLIDNPEAGIDEPFLREEWRRRDIQVPNPPEEKRPRNMPVPNLTKELADYLRDRNRLPYLDRIVKALAGVAQEVGERDEPFCDSRVLKSRLESPCMIELIWSYFHEEAMLVQTMNAISLRFQNRRSEHLPNPMNTLNISSLRPLNNFIWGYIQDEQNRLSLQRRNYEYDHHYGLRVFGRAVGSLVSVDSRSRFLEAFNRLLQLCSIYYQERSNNFVTPDPFPMLNAAREVHMLLAEGSGNQYGDLPWAARREMLMMQWILARPEMSHFLNVGETIPYAEAWMNPVDAVKKMQGWTDVSASHFNTLAVFGERLLLSLRHDRWHDASMSPSYVAGWAQYFRTEIQGYIHSYQVATGVDLTNRTTVDATLPAIHFRNRLAYQDGRLRPAIERNLQK